jgi:hypothetical protein
MYTSELLEKLFEIERSIGVETPMVLRSKVVDAEECVLRMQKEIADVLRLISVSDSYRTRFPALSRCTPSLRN